MNFFDTVNVDMVIHWQLDAYIINMWVSLCYVDCMLKNGTNVIYCVRGKSILSITPQNPIKAKDSSQ